MEPIKSLLPLLPAMLLAGSMALAAESSKEVPPLNVSEDGVWVGVIEDIQDVDVETLKQAEYEVENRIPGPFTITQNLLGVFTLGQSYIDSKRYFDSPRTYLIRFKDEKDETTKSILVRQMLVWNVGDKIRATRNGDGIEVETLELGEISRYAAQQKAERGGDGPSIGLRELIEVIPLLRR